VRLSQPTAAEGRGHRAAEALPATRVAGNL
jgi:hypothetical protein